MPCQCGTTAVAERDAESNYSGCDCGTGSGTGCECGSGAPTPSDRETSLERVVMELDKRVRALEAQR